MNDDLIERLGHAQQKVMSLTVAKQSLERQLGVVSERAEKLEELIIDVVADIRDSVRPYKIEERIEKGLKEIFK